MEKAPSKFELIKLILKSGDIILITLRDNQFDYKCVCCNETMVNLYARFLKFVQNWKRQWDLKHKKA